MEAAPQYWQDPEILKRIFVSSPTGGQVPLSAFAQFAPQNTALAVNHQGLFPSATISFNLGPGVALGDAEAAITAAASKVGLPPTIQTGYSGTAAAYSDSLNSEPLLIGAALAAVYLVLGILYESYIHPITILSTLPSAGVGALLALMLTGTEFSIIAMIGVILLIGLVKKNAIMMIDFALMAERNEGKNSRDSIFEACMLRFRPILMTTMAAMLGAVPLAFGTRYRLRIAAAAGNHNYWRIDRQPDAYTVHYSCGLSLFRPPAALLVGDTRPPPGAPFRTAGAGSVNAAADKSRRLRRHCSSARRARWARITNGRLRSSRPLIKKLRPKPSRRRWRPGWCRRIPPTRSTKANGGRFTRTRL